MACTVVSILHCVIYEIGMISCISQGGDGGVESVGSLEERRLWTERPPVGGPGVGHLTGSPPNLNI